MARRLVIRKSKHDPKQYPPSDKDGDYFYEMWSLDLRKIAQDASWRYRSTEGSTECFNEALSDLNLCFWKAYINWKPSRGEFGKLFWSIWLNHIASTNRRWNATKRQAEIILCSGSPDLIDWLEGRKSVDSDIRFLLASLEGDEAVVAAMVVDGYTNKEIEGVIGRKRSYIARKHLKERIF